VGFSDSFQRLQTRLKMIFHFEEFKAGAGLDDLGDLTFAHLEDNRLDLRREFAFFEGAEAAAGFRGAAFGSFGSFAYGLDIRAVHQLLEDDEHRIATDAAAICGTLSVTCCGV
jgi:hypothetical protein